jgi:hypothetical protein
MLYTPSILNPKASLTAGRWLQTLIGGRASLLVMCFTSTTSKVSKVNVGKFDKKLLRNFALHMQ